MIKPLRKRHLQVWIALAILLPVGIISAYRVVPKQVIDALLQEDKSTALPVEIKKLSRKDYAVFLRSSNDKKHYQLQWNVIDASTAPSSLIYQITQGEKELIGRVAAKGDYYFPLSADSSNSYNFVLYDIIHQQAIDTIKF
jgi:L-2-hydroxyglutarate oxidase LhgO